MSCHKTPGNNLHLNIAQYLNGVQPRERRQVETLFHSLKNECRARMRQSAAHLSNSTDLDPASRAAIHAEAPSPPTQTQVLGHLDRIEFIVRNDPAIPKSRRGKLLEYCAHTRADVEAGDVPNAETWHAWRHLTPALAHARAGGSMPVVRANQNTAYDRSLATEEDVRTAEIEYRAHLAGAHGFAGPSLEQRTAAFRHLANLLELYDTTESGFTALRNNEPTVGEYPLTIDERLARAARLRAARDTTAVSSGSAPRLNLSQSQILSAHNSYHLWRTLCFTDSTMQSPAPDRDARWAELERLAKDADRRSGCPAVRAQDRAAQRRRIRQTIDPKYREAN